MSGRPSHANLDSLFDATLTALPDDTARRRWGRGLNYFRERASKTAGPRTAVLVQDILEFLNDKYGLNQTASTLPAALQEAVQQLEQECERIARDEPVATFSFGILDGGHAPQGARVNEFADEVRKLDNAGADLTINVVFQLAGTISKPDWSGVHGGRLHPARRGMVVNAAPPDGLAGEDLDQFLVDAMHDAVERTERSIKRHHLAWSTEPHREILARLRRSSE